MYVPGLSKSLISHVSPNGKYLAFGSSDYSIGVLDSATLAVSGVVHDTG